MNRTVEMSGQGLVVDGKLIPTLIGEFEHWRASAGRWELILDRAKNDLGVNIISTMIPWIEYELPDGSFDFEGKSRPELNLARFFALLKERGLHCVIHPGPWIYAEMENLGIPDHSAIYPRNSDEFKRRAMRWIKAVSEFLKPHLHPNGGNIILFKADNEINPWHFWFWRDLGLDGGDGHFQRFLKKRYGEIAQVNAAWGTTWTDWSQTKAMARMPHEGAGNLRAYIDLTEFLYREADEQGEWNVKAYKDCGITGVPYFHNLLGFPNVHDWHTLRQQVDAVGMDIYPQAEFNGKPAEGNIFMVAANGHNDFVDVCRIGADMGGLPMLAELQGGFAPFFFPGGILTPEHYRMSFVTAVGSGIRSWNWFMLVDREHWGDAPISDQGQLNPKVAPEIKLATDAFYKHELHRTQRVCELAVAYSPLAASVEESRLEPAVRATLYAAGIDYRRVDLRNVAALKTVTHLIYAGADFLSRAEQQNLLDWVNAGGQLMVFGKGIFRDAQLQPCNRLSFATPDRSVFVWGYNELFNVRIGQVELTLPQPVYTWEGEAHPLGGKMVPSEEAVKIIQVDRMRNLDYTLGYQRPMGAGKMTVIGAVPQAPGMVPLLASLGYCPAAICQPGGIFASVLTRSDAVFVCAVNAGQEAKHVTIRLRDSAWGNGAIYRDIQTGEEFTSRGDELVVRLARKQGRILRRG